MFGIRSKLKDLKDAVAGRRDDAPAPVTRPTPARSEPAPLVTRSVPIDAAPPVGVTSVPDEPAAPATPEPVAISAAALAAGAAASKATGRMLHADMGSTDVDAYRARAVAAGRDPSSVRGGTGLNRAAGGEAFWGPVDNDSSRAKANGHLLTVDQWECISCGTCVEQTDKVFYLPGDGKATPIAQEGPMDLIQEAIDACPVTCIHWVTPEEAADRGLATGMDEG